MNIFQKFQASLQSDRQKLSRMSWRQKLQFCFTYYRGFFFAFLVLCLGLFYIGDVIVQSRTELALQGFFANDEKNLFDAKSIQQDFSSSINLPENQRISFDDSLYVDLNSSADYAASSQGKIVAYIAAKELDFLVVPKPLMEFYTGNLSCYDLSQIVSECSSSPESDSFLSEQLYFSKDGNGIYKACALNLAHSRYMDDAPGYDGPDYYMIVPSNTSHMDRIAEFIQYSFRLIAKNM